MSNQAGGSSTRDHVNPYAPTMQTAAFDQPQDDVEAFRREHLAREMSIKSIGSLFILGAIVMLPFSIYMIAAEQDPTIVVLGVIYVLLEVASVAVAVGLYRLRPWARIGAIVLSVIGLLGIPIGTLFSIYFLYLLLSSKGRVVFTEEYRQAKAQTPHIKYKTPIVVWLVLALLLLGIVALLFLGT